MVALLDMPYNNYNDNRNTGERFRQPTDWTMKCKKQWMKYWQQGNGTVTLCKVSASETRKFAKQFNEI